MIRNVVKFGDPVLEKRAETIDKVDDEIRALVDDMVETMHFEDGIGLAANQVGELKRVAVVDPSAGEDPEKLIVLINPEIVEYGEETEPFNEGCLSFPEIRFDVVRPKSIKVEAEDMDGKEHTYELDGILARVFQHEIDHLNGVLFIDYLKGMSKQMVMTKIKNRMKRGEWDI
jgi:peptide deformylase